MDTQWRVLREITRGEAIRHAGRRPAATDAGNARQLRRVWIDTAAGRMHARVGGEEISGTPVVLVHGMIISGRYMVPTAEELAPLCSVYAIDLPGYGDSVKPREILRLPDLADALAAWMDAMRFPSAHLVANSFGCQILAVFALRHARRVDRLVYYAKAGIRRIRATMRMAIEDRIEDKLPGIAAPTLVVRGGNDPLVPQEWADEVVRRLPRGELKVLPGLGHTINYTAPKEFVSAMRPFLRV